MNKLLQFATNTPFIFVLIIVITSYLLMTVSFGVRMLARDNGVQQNLLQAAAGCIIVLIFGYILWHLGWLKDAGLTRFGGWSVWRVALIPLVYGVVAAVYAFTGDFKFDLSKPGLLSAVGLIMLVVGVIEEVVFRGIVQQTFIRLWHDTTWQILGSVALGAFIFGGSHMIWALFGKPVPQTALQSLSAFLAGIVYGAFTLSTGSLWPAILFHGLVNAAVNVKIVGIPGYQETIKSGVQMVLFDLPIVAYALYVLFK